MHLCRCAESDALTEVQHQHPVGEIHDKAHVVLDQDHGHTQFRAYVENEPSHVLGLLGVHAGDRLVQEEQGRIHGEGSSEFDPLLHAVGKHADGVNSVTLNVKELDKALDNRAISDLLPACRATEEKRRCQRVVHVQTSTEHQVVQHRQVVEQLNVLEHARHTESSDVLGRLAEEFLPPEEDAALLRVVDTRNAIEDRCLARSVGADDGKEFTRPDVEAHIANRLGATKGEGHPLNSEDLLRAQLNHRFRRLYCLTSRRDPRSSPRSPR